MKTTVINIYGAPGSGKSTLAAELYAFMKQNGYSVELVREEIKDWAWQGKKPTVFEQIYITNKQMLAETNLYGKVEYLITDSPIYLGDFYNQYYHNCSALKGLEQAKIDQGFKLGVLSKNIIDLYTPIDDSIYKTEGRYSSLEEAKQLDKELLRYLDNKHCMDLRILNGSPCNRYMNAFEWIKRNDT